MWQYVHLRPHFTGKADGRQAVKLSDGLTMFGGTKDQANQQGYPDRRPIRGHVESWGSNRPGGQQFGG
jgi:hypothetical protein